MAVSYKGYGTPEAIERRRRIAEALAQQMFSGGSPRNVGDALNQGLGNIGAALGYRGITKKADKAEREAREASTKRSRSAILEALGAPKPEPAASAAPARAQGMAGAQDALKGVSPKSTDAFGNLQASYGGPLTVTSGVRTPERNRKVGGAEKSRHMLQHGGDAIDIDTSGMSEAEKLKLIKDASAKGFSGIGVYDNAIHLDMGPRRAWGPSYGRESVPGWAQPVIESHLAGGERTAQAQPRTMTDAQPQADMQTISGLAKVLNDPWASPADKQMAGMLIEREMAKMQGPEPMSEYQRRQIGLQEKGLGLDRAQFAFEKFKYQNPQLPKEAQLFQFAQENPEFAPFMKELDRGVSVNVNTGETMPQVGTIPKGFELRQTETGWQMAPIPGGPADIEQQQAEAQRKGREKLKDRYGKVVLEDIDRVIEKIENAQLPTTGFAGPFLAGIGGTEARDVKALTDTIRANVGFDRLQQMREASPTGGALGQVSELENRLLQSTLGNLEQSQSKEQLLENIVRMKEIYLDIVHGTSSERQKLVEQGEITPQENAEIEKLYPSAEARNDPQAPPEGVDPELWQHLTPEERQLWQN